MKLNKKSRAKVLKKIAESVQIQDILDKAYAATAANEKDDHSLDVNSADDSNLSHNTKFLDALEDAIIDSVYSEIPEL